MASSNGRLFAPLITSMLYTKYGPVAPWSLDIILVCIIVVLWTSFFVYINFDGVFDHHENVKAGHICTSLATSIIYFIPCIVGMMDLLPDQVEARNWVLQDLMSLLEQSPVGVCAFADDLKIYHSVTSEDDAKVLHSALNTIKQ
nr:unnamed protein product [Haemonchus contortus]